VAFGQVQVLSRDVSRVDHLFVQNLQRIKERVGVIIPVMFDDYSGRQGNSVVGVMYKCVHVDVDVCKGDLYLAAAVGDDRFVTTLVSVRVVHVAGAALLSAAVFVDAVHVSIGE